MEGDLQETLRTFDSQGGKCDVVFLDAIHPIDLILTKPLARNENTLFLYHHHFRSIPDAKLYFLEELENERFVEHACMKTLCSLGFSNPVPVLRESCFGTNSNPTDQNIWWKSLF